MFVGTENLETLNLDGNQLKRVDWEIFNSSNHLRLLFLTNNKIESLDGGFAENNIISVLFLDKNYITKIEKKLVQVHENTV